MSDFKVGSIEMGPTSGLDAFLKKNPEIVTPTKSVRVASLQQLDPFQRISADTLVHKSTQDLWALRRDGNDLYIDRLVQDGAVVKE